MTTETMNIHQALVELKTLDKRIESAIKFSIFVTFILVPLYIGLGNSVGIFLYDNLNKLYLDF